MTKLLLLAGLAASVLGVEPHELKGGKAEKAPTPPQHLVSKFTIANALDAKFDGSYTATGKKRDGFNIYKSTKGRFIYPHHVKDGTLHYIFDDNLDPSTGVLGGMLLLSGDGFPKIRGHGPEMFGGRVGLKGSKGNFHWNPEMVITPVDTESCVSWGFGSRMVPCCSKCETADSGTCQKHPAGFVGGTSKAFAGMSCDKALEAWQAEQDKAAADKAAADKAAADKAAADKAAADKAAADKFEKENEACVSWGFGAFMVPCCSKCEPAKLGTCEKAGSVGGTSKAFAGVSCATALESWKAEQDKAAADKAAANRAAAEASGVDPKVVFAAAGAAAGAFEATTAGGTVDQAAQAAAAAATAAGGTAAAASAASELIKAGKTPADGDENVQSAVAAAKEMVDDTQLMTSLVADKGAEGAPGAIGQEAAMESKAAKGTTAQAATAAGAAAGLAVEFMKTSSAEAGSEAAQAAIASVGAGGVPAKVIAEAAGEAAGAVDIDKNDAKDAADAASAAAKDAGGSAAAAGRAAAFSGAGKTAKKGDLGPDVAAAVDVGEAELKHSDPTDKGAVATNAGRAAANFLRGKSATPNDVALAAGVSAGNVAEEMGEDAVAAGKAAAAAAAETAKTPEELKLEEILKQPVKVGSSTTPAAPGKHSASSGSWTGIWIICGFLVVLIALALFVAARRAFVADDGATPLAGAAPPADDEEPRLGGSMLRDTDAAVDHVIVAGGDLTDVMHPERVEKIKKVFYAMDEDGDGTVDGSELLDFAMEYKHNPKWPHPEKRIKHLMEKIDRNQDGKIDEREFVVFFARFTNNLSDGEFNKGVDYYLSTGKALFHKQAKEFQGK